MRLTGCQSAGASAAASALAASPQVAHASRASLPASGVTLPAPVSTEASTAGPEVSAPAALSGEELVASDPASVPVEPGGATHLPAAHVRPSAQSENRTQSALGPHWTTP